ncbi:MAG: DUF4230 domain-containing protein [bacterium]
MSENIHYIPSQPASALRPGGAPRWAGILVLTTLAIIGGLVSWNWLDNHFFSIGLEDAGSTTVDQAVLLQRVQAFELVTAKDTYDTRSNTDFRQRLNLGVTKFKLPGFVAGQELDVKAEVTVSAGVDMAQISANDIEVIQQGTGSVVIVRIPQAQITSTEINPDSFDISTGKGLVTRFTSTVGLGGRDVRDGAVEAVTSIAQEEAVRGGLLNVASLEAKARLQNFLQSLPQDAKSNVTYLVEYQAPLPN